MKELFDECDAFKKSRIQIVNIENVLKPVIKRLDDESLSLYTIEDVNRDFENLSPRSGTSLLVKEIKSEWDQAGVKPNEVFNQCKPKGKNYVSKDDLRDSFREFVPKLSREVTEEVLKGFENDRIDYNEYLTYFDARDPRKPKTEDMKVKARNKWILKYTKVWYKYGIEPNEILEEADKNNDGTLELNELNKVIKNNIKDKDLSYNDLRNIMDALDSNNDGKVSTKEYREVIYEYGTKPKSKFQFSFNQLNIYNFIVEDQKAVEETANQITSKICEKYDDKFDNAIKKFSDEYDVDFTKNGVRKGYTETRFVDKIAKEPKLVTEDEATALYDMIKDTNGATGSVIKGKDIYTYLSQHVDDSMYPKKKPEPQPVAQEFNTITEKLENRSTEYLPAIFRKIPKPTIMKKNDLPKYLGVFYRKENNCTPEDVKELSEEILDGREELKLAELYSSIKDLTSYKSKMRDKKPALERIISQSIKEMAEKHDENSKEPEFNVFKDKDFTTSIFKMKNSKEENERYIKFDLLDEFYSNKDDYKTYAKSISEGNEDKKPKNGFAAFGVNPKGKEPVAEFTLGQEVPDEGGFGDEVDKFEDEEEEKGDKKKNDDRAGGLFAKLGQRKEDILAIKAANEKDLLKNVKKFDFDSIRKEYMALSPTKRSGTITVTPEEIKEFNSIVATFLKDFIKISDK